MRIIEKDEFDNPIRFKWTEKPSFEITTLKDFDMSDEFVVRYYQYYKHQLMLQNSISSVLHLIKFSQNPLARRNFYYSLCYFTALTKVNERWFKYWITKNCPYSVLYTVQDILLFARGMEYHLAGTNLWDLNISMWYDKTEFNSMFLPYRKYILKVTAAVFYTLWSYIENIRRNKYNEYVKGHYFGSDKKGIRKVHYRRIKFFWRGGFRRLLKWRFFRYFMEHKYRVFRHSFHYNHKHDYNTDINRIKLFSTDKWISFHKHMERLPWKTYWTPLITDLLILKLSLYSNTIVSHNTAHYTLYSRLDYTFFGIILWYFTWKNYYVGFLYRMISDMLLNEWFGNVLHNQDNTDYGVVLNLYESRQLILHNQTFTLKTLVTKIDISNFSERTYLDLLLSKYRFDMTDHLARPNYYFWWAPESSLALIPKFSGTYEEADYMLGRTVVWTNYWMWRDFSKFSEEKILYEAKLEMPALSKFLTVEYYYYGSQTSLYAMFVRVLRNSNIFVFSKSYRKYKEIASDPKFDRKRRYYDPKDDWKRPNIHPTLKILNQTYCKLVRDWYLQFYAFSDKLDVFTHFLFKNDQQVFKYFNTHQTKLWINIPVVFFSIRRYYYVYTDVLPMYRRYPKKRCTMSRNDPEFREIWDVYYQKMRRTGIRIDIDLPYYSKSDDLDHIKELSKRRRNLGFEQWHEKRVIIK